jgi:NADP-dependent 3-hydroxy acid dehydrogenase YdfG
MHTLTRKFPQKRAFITGAASGLGLALCQELAADGWTIGMADLQPEPLAKAAQLIQSQGGKPLTYVLDVSDKGAYAAVAKEFLAQAGGIDLLCNNAGVGDGGAFEAYGLENWEWMVGINQMGVVYGCHFFIPTMKTQRSGHILNTASCAAIACAPGMAAYNTTKAAVVAISETLHSELAGFGIGVTVLQPWFFKTNIAQYARGGDTVKAHTEKMMNASTMSAAEVAQTALQKAAKGKLYVVLPREARRMWFLGKVRQMAERAMPIPPE